jgi:2-polyprenyl-3-methyl-5-hydroxy-6-metoxy-1,4-benzoquinol methylase
VLKDTLVRLGVLPSRYAWPNPFKIVKYNELLKGIEIHKTDVILDLGCGSGLPDLLLARRAARVVGVDVSIAQIARARALAATYARAHTIDYLCTPLETAGFERHQFDKVVSFCVLEHIANRGEVLGILSDILKPGGLLMISVDSLATISDPALIAKHQRDHAVQTYFTPAGLWTLLEEHGFGSIRVWPIFRSPYAKHLFEAGIRSGFQYQRYWKFGTLARLIVDEWRYRRTGSGMFLCATATRLS